MESYFDKAAKVIGSGLTRRKALLQAGGAMLGVLGFGSRAMAGPTLAQCNSYCKKFPSLSNFLACRSRCMNCDSGILCGATAQSLVCCTATDTCVDNVCTTGDLCAGVVCNQRDFRCAQGVCDPATGTCQYTNFPSDTLCYDEECYSYYCLDGFCQTYVEKDGQPCYGGSGICYGNYCAE